MGYKLLGSKDYKFGAVSPSDSTGYAMGFETKELALKHIETMNLSLESFDTDKGWNKKFWTEKPQPWILVEF